MNGRIATLAIAVALLASGAGWVAYQARVGTPPGTSAPRAAAAAAEPPATTAPEASSASVGSTASAAAHGIPDVLPDFSLATLEGPPRSLSSFDSPSLVVNFWATWCAPCRREIPLLRQLRAERAAKGVEIVGIAVDFRADVVRYARQVKLDYPLLIGEQDGLEAAQAFGLDMGFPFTIFADHKRRVIAVKIGELHRNEAEFILDQIAGINAGSLQVENSRKAIAAALRQFAVEREQKTGKAAVKGTATTS